jgi:lipopolysaccharide/colanic/teichoic acid biosynthesis glycosyltransferase
MHNTSTAERRPLQWALKRTIDVTAAAFGLTVLSPALGLLAAAVRLDSRGPALFRQERVGRNGATFDLVKFRTMHVNAPVLFNTDGSTKITQHDNRVTAIGRYLRGGLDELPQLVNVLRGDMSLVGPRPDMKVHAAMYSEEERGKLVVRPGMTSLAAVLGRNEIPWRTRMQIDLRYVERWSLALDAKVIAQTLLLPFGLRPFRFREIVGDLL